MIASLVLALLAVVNNPNTSSTWACNGITATFTANFPYLSSSDLVVTSTTADGSTVTTLVKGTDWTVDLSSTSSVGTVTLNSPATKCPSGNTLKISRILALTQPQPFKGQTSFNPVIHETAYDRLLMQLQQINATSDTSVLATKGDLVGRAVTGPSRIPVGTNGQVLTVNSLNGNGVAWTNPGVTTDATLSNDGFLSPLAINLAHSNTWSVPQTIAVLSVNPALTLQGGASGVGYGLQATGGGTTTFGAAAILATGGCGTLSCGPGIIASGSTKGPGVVAQGSAVRGALMLTAQAQPSIPVEGDMYQDSTSHRPFIWDGSSWVGLDSAVADAPILGSGTSASHLTCQAASGAQAGCLSSTDWTTFNNKSSNGVSLTTANTWTATQTVAPGGATPAGNAITATGGTSSGTGVAATGGTPNGIGVTGTGTGTAPGGTFTAGGGGTPANGAVVLTPQAAPSAPSNGAVWTTTVGLFARVNGATQGPFAVGTNPMLNAKTGAQLIANATTTIIVFGTVARDSDSAYNAATGRYTVPAGKGGDYSISASILYAGAPGSNPSISIFKNAVQLFANQAGANTPGAGVTMQISVIAALAAGDIIDIRTMQSSGAGVSTSGTPEVNYFSLKRLAD